MERKRIRPKTVRQTRQRVPKVSYTRQCYLFLFVVVLLLLLAGTGVAAENHQSGDYTYTLTARGDATITAYSGEDEALVVPGTLDGHPVVALGDFAFDSSRFSSVALPEGLQTIGRYAFNWCDVMETITLPDSLRTIEGSAFAFCGALSSIALPDGLQSLGSAAFESCWFHSITIPKGLNSIGANPFYHCSIEIIEVSPENEHFISIDGMLVETASMTLIAYPGGREDEFCVVPDGILSIGSYAFEELYFPEGVTLPEGLLSIEAQAFASCGGFTSIVFPRSLQSIGASAFYQADLASVTLPEGLQYLGNGAFHSCYELKSVYVPAALSTIEGNPFANTAPETIQVSPDNETFEMIGQALFDRKLKRLIAYVDLGQETTYVVPPGTLSIGASAFLWSTTLTHITLPDGLQSIGEYAFTYCKSLTDISLPDTLKFIGDGAFNRCDQLVLTVPADSYALEYANTNDIPYQYTDSQK